MNSLLEFKMVNPEKKIGCLLGFYESNISS